MVSSNYIVSDKLLPLTLQVKKGVKNVLFVCTGNICRSPTAEYLLRYELDKQKIHNIEVASAGLMASNQQAAVKEMVQVGKEFGINLDVHRSQALTKRIVEEASLIFVMERVHQESIADTFPNHQAKVFLLSLFDSDSNGIDINDPLGMTIYNFRYCFNRIYQIVLQLPHILQIFQTSD